MFRLVGDQHVAGRVRGHAVRAVELGAKGRAAVPGEGFDPHVAGYAADRVDVARGHGLAVESAGVRGQQADDAVAVVGDGQVPGRVHRHAARVLQLRRRARAAVAAESASAVAGHGVDVAGGAWPGRRTCPRPGRHDAGPVVAVVGDGQVPGRVHRDVLREAEAGLGGRAAVAAEALRPVSGHRVDVARRHGLAIERARGDGDHPDAAKAWVGEHQVPVRVHPHATDVPAQRGLGGGPAVTEARVLTAAGHRVQVPGGHRLAVERTALGGYHVHPCPGFRLAPAGDGDHQVAVGVRGHPDRVVQRGAQRGRSRLAEAMAAVAGHRI